MRTTKYYCFTRKQYVTENPVISSYPFIIIVGGHFGMNHLLPFDNVC